MGNGLSGARQVLKELTRAVAVLSLLLFALGLTQPGTAAPPTAAVASLVAPVAVSYAAFPVQPAFARQRATALSRAPPFA